MNFLYIVSRMKRWTFFNIFRAVVNFLIGLGLALISLFNVVGDEDSGLRFQGSPWVLPTICLTYLAVLIFNHLPLPGSALYRPWQWFGSANSALLVRPHTNEMRNQHRHHHHHHHHRGHDHLNNKAPSGGETVAIDFGSPNSAHSGEAPRDTTGHD